MGVATRADVRLRLDGIDIAPAPCRHAPWRRLFDAWRSRRERTPAGQIAQVLGLSDKHGSALAVIPADRRIDLTAMAAEFGRSFRVDGRQETDSLTLLGDDTRKHEIYVDQSLIELAEVYLTADHGRCLARVDGETFRSLFYGSWCGRISRPR